MSESIEQRSAARAALVTQLETVVTSAQAVFGELPNNPAGVSPFVTVESDGSFPRWEPAIYNQFRFVVAVWVNREVAEDTENTLDQLAYEIAQAIGGWHNGVFWQFSETGYFGPVDVWPGQWRYEFHYIEIEWE